MVQIITNNSGGGGGVGAYKYKGSVNTYEDLPTSGMKIGDVYNVIEEHTTEPQFPAGANVAWTGTEWDVLGGTFDLSDYQKKLIEGEGINIDENNEISVDTSVIATQTDLANGLATKQDVISDLDTIRSNANAGKNASDTIATYGNIVTHNVDEFATSAQGALADTAVQPGDNVSDLNNDAGYITKDVNDLTNYTKTSDLGAVALSNSYADLDDKPTIGNATITIQKNSANVDNFTTNATTNKSINITITKSDVGLSNVDNTSDLNKPISSATQDALNLKANTADLSQVATSNDYNDLDNLPTIGDATITLQKNGTNVNTFTTNATSDKTINLEIGKSDVGLGNVDNTSDLNKPISTATQTALNNKQDKLIPGANIQIASDGKTISATDTVTTVIDNLNSTSSTAALSANQGKVLKDAIDNISGLGKFLSLWNSATGLPISFPLATPYTYTTGDWFMVEVVGSTNYMPNGSSYTGAASTTVDTNDVNQGDVYIFDGTNWLFQDNNEVEVSFANLAGQPTDNANLATALGNKQDVSNMVSTLTGADNTHYPTAKAVADAIAASGGGDMLASVYDPDNVAANVYDYNNFINTPTIPTKVSELSNDSNYATVSQIPTNYVDLSTNQSVSGTKTFTTSPVVPSKTTAATNSGTAIATEAQVYKKQDTISDLATIRSGASAGATALQPNDNISELNNDAGYITGVNWGSIGGTLSDQVDLSNALGAKANDSDVVKLTGNQTIAGTKTFSTSPVVPSKTTAATNTGTAVATEAQVYKKQDTLVSGTNIKTVNSTSLLGSGNVAVQPTLVSGTNIKTINNTSLLGSGNIAVQPTLVSGTNIKTVGGTSLLGSGDVSVGVTSVNGNTGDVVISPGAFDGTPYTQAEYDALPSSKNTDGIWRVIYQ